MVVAQPWRRRAVTGDGFAASGVVPSGHAPAGGILGPAPAAAKRRLPGRLAPAAARGAGHGLGPVSRRARLAIVFAAIVLAPAAIFAVSQMSGGVHAAKAHAPGRGGVTYAGVAYGVVGSRTAQTISQPGQPPVTASGIFEIVTLRMRASDARPHVVSFGLLTLHNATTKTYYGASSPNDIGLSPSRWGAMSGATALPATGALVVKAVFDVPPTMLAHPVSLHIGGGSIDQTPAATIELPGGRDCCGNPAQAAPTRARPAPALTLQATDAAPPPFPSPVLG